MSAKIFTVEYVHTDEATPRSTHTRTVKAANLAEAQQAVVLAAALAGDRVMTTDVDPNTYFEERFEHYRARGEDHATAYEWAAADQQAKFMTPAQRAYYDSIAAPYGA
jgi:hypothetical protein